MPRPKKNALPKQAPTPEPKAGSTPMDALMASAKSPKRVYARTSWTEQSMTAAERGVKAAIRIGRGHPGAAPIATIASKAMADLLVFLANVPPGYTPPKGATGAWEPGMHVRIKEDGLPGLIPLISHAEAQQTSSVWTVMVVNGRQVLIGHEAGDLLPIKTSLLLLA